MNAGYFFGFSWTEAAVIKYTSVAANNINYCAAADTTFGTIGQAKLAPRSTNKEYSIKLTVCGMCYQTHLVACAKTKSIFLLLPINLRARSG